MSDTLSISDIAEIDLQLWRHNPVSKVVLQYCIDYGNTVAREVMDHWLAGDMHRIDEKEMRGRVLAYQHIAALNHETIRLFYEGEKPVDAA